MGWCVKLMWELIAMYHSDHTVLGRGVENRWMVMDGDKRGNIEIERGREKGVIAPKGRGR